MSIDESLLKAVGKGDLAFLPLDLSDPIERVMLISKEVKHLLDGTQVAQAARAKSLLADLQSFVKGEALSMCFRPYEHGEAYFGRLDPVGSCVWDVRSRKPNPGIRVLGMFAEVDTFVAFNWWPRSKKVSWSGKEPLGDKNSINWRIAMHDCDTQWHATLPGEVPIAGLEVNRYVSANYSLC